ncbi:MAG: hypothetical protein ACPGXK_15440 [Phycisphaerae bacterium]
MNRREYLNAKLRVLDINQQEWASWHQHVSSLTDIRMDRVLAARRDIECGRYDQDGYLDMAIDRMVNEYEDDCF